MDKPVYLERPAAAEYLTSRGLRTTKGTLGKLVSIGGGPVFRKFGKRAVYLVEDLDKWIDTRISAPRSSSTGVVPA